MKQDRYELTAEKELMYFEFLVLVKRGTSKRSLNFQKQM